MSDSPDRDQLRIWLNASDTLELLSRLAASICGELRRRQIPLSCDRLGPRVTPPDPDQVEAVRSELVIFVLENAPKILKRIDAGDPNIAGYLRNAFIRHLLDVDRKAGVNPFRHSYKRAADVLRKADGIFTVAPARRFTVFSLFPQNYSTAHLTEEDLAGIPFPPDVNAALVPDAVSKAEVLLQLARWFYQCVSERWSAERIWIKVRDLVGWIRFHVELDEMSRLERLSGGAEALEKLPDSHPISGKTWFDDELVKQWAAVFVRRLKPRDQKVFYLRCAQDLGFVQIARRTEYQGPSGAKAAFDRVVDELRTFLRDLPWLSPDDLYEDAFDRFLQILLSFLKSSVSEP